MISYNKRLFCTIAILFPLLFQCNVIAQTTKFYKQIKVVKNNQTIANGKGGQFISFYADICYDSNNKGVTVNNGQLERVSTQGDKYTKYKGKSYWGEVTYQFTNDLETLAVIKGDGTIYVYQRATPPTGITTCSLIKSQSSGGGVPACNTYPQTNYPPATYGGSGGNNSNTSSSNSQSSTTQNETYRIKCYHCNQTGEMIIDPSRGVPQFGLGNNEQKYCPKCGQNFRKGTHAHITCGYCGGKGYVERRY